MYSLPNVELSEGVPIVPDYAALLHLILHLAEHRGPGLHCQKYLLSLTENHAGVCLLSPGV